MIDTKELLEQLSEIRGIKCTDEDLRTLINRVVQWQVEQPVKGSDVADAIRRMEMKFNE